MAHKNPVTEVTEYKASGFHILETGQGSLLIVDDSKIVRDMLSDCLERQGYTVAVAENGRQALEMIRALEFDLIFLDIMMPEMSGYQVLEYLKADETLRHIPVIVISAVEELDSVVRCIEMGAEDYLPKLFDEVLLRARISACLEKKRLHDREVLYLRQIEKEKKRSDDLLKIVIPIGVALSMEKDFNRLLERILLEAKSFCNADAGTLYLRTENNYLKFVVLRNDSLNIAMGGTTGKEIPFPMLCLYDEVTGEPNYRNVVTCSVLKGVSINIVDVYQVEGFDFSGTRAFDEKTGYHSISFLTVPLKNNLHQVIGVLQLINARDPGTDKVIPFDQGLQEMIESLSALATVTLEAYIREQNLRQKIEELRIEIDEAKKARQVAEITESDYFRDLQQKVRKLRARSTPHQEPEARSQEPEAETLDF